MRSAEVPVPSAGKPWHRRQPGDLEWMPGDYFRRATAADIFPDRPEAMMEADLGCGDGTFLAGLAAHHPERNFLGVERLLGRVRGSCRKAQSGGCTNVRVLRLETEYTVDWLLPAGAFNRIHLLFPDPWPKKKHAGKRLFRPDFLARIHRLLVPGGEFLFKTDHEEYAAEAADVASGLAGYERIGWSEGAFPYPVTDFENQWLGQGKVIHQLRLRRRD